MQALHHDHLPVETTSRDLTGGTEGPCRADVHTSLGVFRGAVSVPEEVVDVGVVEVGIGWRELMTVIGLQREESRIVDLDLVADLDALDNGGIRRDVNRVADRFDHQTDVTFAVRVDTTRARQSCLRPLRW